MVASAICSLFHQRAAIEHRRWRGYATARLIPVFTHYNLPLDRLRVDLRDDTGIVCPEPFQPMIAALLDAELARAVPRVEVVSRLVEARWRPDHTGCAFEVAVAALYAEQHAIALELPALVGDRNVRAQLRTLAVTGTKLRHGPYGAWGPFYGNLEQPGSEAAFPASPALVTAMVERVIRDRTDRFAAIEAVARKLGALDQRRCAAHLARAVLVTQGPRAAALRLRAMRDDSVRDAGSYLVAREAIRQGQIETAQQFAAVLRSERLQQRLRIALAWHQLRAGDPLRARRTLGAAMPAHAFEHWRLQSTIAMRVRTEPRSLHWPQSRYDDDDVSPTWFGEPVVDARQRHRILIAIALARLPDLDANARLAATELERIPRHPVARREVIESLHDLTADPWSTILRLREHASREQLEDADILIAELIAWRAEALVESRCELPHWVRRGIDRERPPTTQAALRRREQAERIQRDNDDAATVAALLGQLRPEPECPPAAERRIALEEQRSLDRALYDEGSVWGGEPRRLGIVTAARACLRDAVEHDTWEPALVECRSRTLATLGGHASREVIESAIAHAKHDRYTLRLYEALCWIDRDAAARSALTRATAATDREDELLREVLSLVEAYRGVPVGFARTWCASMRALCTTLKQRQARAFMAEVVELRGLPDAVMLDWIAARVANDAVTDARTALAQAHELCSALTREWPVEAAARLAADDTLRETLQLLRRVRVVTRARPWTGHDWRSLLTAAASPTSGVVERGIVRRCARQLGCDEARLLAGDLVGLGAIRESVIADGYRVQLLQKRADILQYLRFADVPVVNCYRSDSRLYASGRNDVIWVWKDPLSMCFRVERADGRPYGFVFGSFVELATGGIAVALNGLYLARQRLDQRSAVLRAIERMLCAPLGIKHLAVANQFGGRGPMPFDYEYRRVSATRLRALRRNGSLVTEAWDDISYDVNVPVVLSLYWKTL